MLTDDEKNVSDIVLEDKEFGYRAKIILLKEVDTEHNKQER
jgi:hypothetical protein